MRLAFLRLNYILSLGLKRKVGGQMIELLSYLPLIIILFACFLAIRNEITFKKLRGKRRKRKND